MLSQWPAIDGSNPSTTLQGYSGPVKICAGQLWQHQVSSGGRSAVTPKSRDGVLLSEPLSIQSQHAE